jgi:hypothetical protein
MMKWGTPVKARRPLGCMEPCIPTVALKVQEGPLWVHEIKHDGYRILAKSGIARDCSHAVDSTGPIAAKNIKGAFLSMAKRSFQTSMASPILRSCIRHEMAELRSRNGKTPLGTKKHQNSDSYRIRTRQRENPGEPVRCPSKQPR